VGVQLSREIQRVSERFARTFRQARAAEDYGWSQVAGCGYRKALEILVKDWAIDVLGHDPETVRVKPLKGAIESYCTSDRLKDFAQASRSLGNDETHWYKKYADKDVRNLRELLELAIRDFELELEHARLDAEGDLIND
jgi:hypothetical protein